MLVPRKCGKSEQLRRVLKVSGPETAYIGRPDPLTLALLERLGFKKVEGIDFSGSELWVMGGQDEPDEKEEVSGG